MARVSAPSAAAGGVGIWGGPANDVSNKELSYEQFLDFLKQNNNNVTLGRGASVYVYVPTTIGATIKLGGFNKNSPFRARIDRNKPAGWRYPGYWVEIQAKARRTKGSDKLEFASFVPGPNGEQKSDSHRFTVRLMSFQAPPGATP